MIFKVWKKTDTDALLCFTQVLIYSFSVSYLERVLGLYFFFFFLATPLVT